MPLRVNETHKQTAGPGHPYNLRTCDICPTKFKPKSPQHRHCSRRCAYIAVKLNREAAKEMTRDAAIAFYGSQYDDPLRHVKRGRTKQLIRHVMNFCEKFDTIFMTQDEIAEYSGLTLRAKEMERAAAERGKLEHEMNVARDIQMELLPKTFPKLPGLDMFAFTVPARHVGGDCYDVIDIGDGKLAITIGDVSGKGTPAAILMANVQAAVRVLSESRVPAAELITRVNRLVHGYTEDGVFITFFYSILDTRTGEVVYVNAGHNPPCILRRDGNREYLDRGGLVIGAIPNAEYEEGRATLHTGDDLVLYTDGVTEAENLEDEMFGEERLEQLLIEHRHASAREIEERVYTSVKDFAAGASQTDDLTMVIVKMTSDSTDDETTEVPDSPRIAKGGSPAARGAPATGALWGPATANGSPEQVN